MIALPLNEKGPGAGPGAFLISITSKKTTGKPSAGLPMVSVGLVCGVFLRQQTSSQGRRSKITVPKEKAAKDGEGRKHALLH
ncbi:MAG: hypothetical protein AB7F21_12530 [Desulfuromonadales bacterium]